VLVEKLRQRRCIASTQAEDECGNFGIGFSGHRDLLVKSHEAEVISATIESYDQLRSVRCRASQGIGGD
jgi:hypothetical protein